MTVNEVALENIYNNPFQKRHTYNDIEDLARNIAVDGLQQIPKGRYNADGAQLKFGHRRCAAFRWLKENWKKEGLQERYQGYTVMPIEIEELTDEQMYRGATVENSQRSELSPIERMEEMKGWVEFGYTSKQIADLYPGMSDATVRGLLYFDKLMPEAKEALHTGVITQGQARALLSLQKVTTSDEIVETMELLKKGETDWGGKATSEEIIEDKFEGLTNVKPLWTDQRGGKPRAASSEAWLLDMKNFPNKLLPNLTVEEALAASLEPRDDAFKRVLEEFLNEGLLIEGNDAGLSENDLKFINHLIDPPACSACPLYTRFDGTHYCGMRVCFERKNRAWNRQRMHHASKALGIALYNPEADGDLLVLQDTFSNAAHAELFKKKSKDLRLAFMEDIDRKKYQSGYEGISNGAVVVVVGNALEKLQEKKEEARERKVQGVDIEVFIGKMKEEKGAALLWEAALYVKSLFDGFPHSALECLLDAPRYGWGSDDGVPEPETGWNEKQNDDHLRREFAFHMLDQAEDIDRDDADSPLAVLAAGIVKTAKGWGVKMPASFAKLAAEMDAEIEAVAAETLARAKKGKKE